jgi:hypothetical protein
MKHLELSHNFGAAALLLLASVAAAQVPAMPGTPPAPPQAGTAPAPAQALPATPGVPPPPPARWTTAQIREAFDLADSDSNGELTRAEAQQLRIMPRSFEDMDQNKNGILERSEYEAVFVR